VSGGAGTSPRVVRARRVCLAALLSAVVLTAHAQPAVPNLEEVAHTRIDGDRSAVCVQIARVELGATPEVATADECAGKRADRPPANARFEIGSISKAFVGVLIAEMVERGEMKLDEPLEALVPKGTATPVIAQRPITLTDLLTHTSGLPALPPGFAPKGGTNNPYAEVGAELVYGALAKVTLPGPPPQAYSYSNWAFMILSDAAARRAGKPFDRLLRERVLDPLRLDDTVVARNDRLVGGHTSYGAATANWDFPVNFAGAGGVRCTLADLVRFARVMLGEVPAATPASLKRALIAARTKLRPVNEKLDLGFAWHLLKSPGRPDLTFHNGMTGGFSSTLVLDLANRRAAIVLADAFGGFDDLAFRLLDPKAPLAAPRRVVALDLPAAEKAVGRYQIAPGFVLTVSFVDDRLYAQATGQSRFELLQDSRGDYYTTVTDLLVRFKRDADGRAEGLTLFQGGAALPAARID
jgi:D-alanyl-D-alanine-carboxypeptidase/D-alanyl-D-alanine-endopeptidase